ncbi:hypothetical protein OUZ56_025511 [Daphnia magna]|uniref:Integrase zinc-binding domain-containing protein n=1 Tax=Daphnia magna TaxID=35525 RepID=A0ABQ9ZK25_9CRUS|nr:hypothetical protein OUZ56_025511 [Daphnia magna]
MRSVMMSNPPISVNAFLSEVHHLEVISESLVGSSSSATTTGRKEVKMGANDLWFQAAEALTNQVAVLTRSKDQWSNTCLSDIALRETKFSALIAVISATSLGIALNQTLVGQNHQPWETGQPVRRGKAGNKRNCPTTATPVNSPFIMAGVFRIGELKALVDSGAKNGVIWEEVLLDHSCFNINNPSKYRFIGGTPVNNVVGEIILTVRYRGTIVDLPRVAVVRKRVYPFVLGVEWIVQSGDSIKGVGGVAEVVMPGAGLVSTVENKTGKSGVPKKAGDYKEAIEELSNIGEILEEVEKKKSGGNASVERSYVLKTASARVPANRMGYFKYIRHLSGAANVIVDALSGSPVNTAAELELVGDVMAVVQSGGYSSQEIGLLQHADEGIRQVVLALKGFPSELSFTLHSEFVLHKGVLYKNNAKSGRPWLLVVPSIIRKEIIEEFHVKPDGGHRGVEKPLARLCQRFWWMVVAWPFANYVKSCHFFQTLKPRATFKSPYMTPPLERLRPAISSVWHDKQDPRVEADVTFFTMKPRDAVV